MNNEKLMCWSCAWRDITGPGNDPTLGCGHPDWVHRQFCGSPSVETCGEYIEDDPDIRVSVTRDTRETFMRTIHQMAVDSGNFTEVEPILDYFQPDTRSYPAKITCNDFKFITEVNFGVAEGIYLQCYAEGYISEDSFKNQWLLGTYRALGTSLADMQIFGKLGGTLNYTGQGHKKILV